MFPFPKFQFMVEDVYPTVVDHVPEPILGDVFSDGLQEDSDGGLTGEEPSQGS